MARVVTFGEALLRLSPPARQRLEQARSLEVWPAGAELNVAIGLARLGSEAAWVSRLPRNPLGRAIETHARAHGVDVGELLWADDARLGVYFAELGDGARPTSVVYDRADSAFATLDPDELDWPPLLAGADALHVTGITPALSAACAEATARAVAAAADAGLHVSYDVNLRRKLTTPDAARETLERLAPSLDLVFASARDAVELFPALDGADDVAAGLRDELGVPLVVTSSTVDDVAPSGPARVRTAAGEAYETIRRPWLPAVHPIGAGDAFCAGFLHALLGGRPLVEPLEVGDAVSALKLSIPGDAPLVSPADVEALLGGRSVGVER